MNHLRDLDKISTDWLYALSFLPRVTSALSEQTFEDRNVGISALLVAFSRLHELNKQGSKHKLVFQRNVGKRGDTSVDLFSI